MRGAGFGFGCAGLARPIKERERFALLEAALAAGIRHFDVARYYGHGEAESILGKFLQESKLRDSVTITTKFGLEPAALAQSSRSRPFVSIARWVAGLHPRIHRTLSKVGRHGVRSNRFDPENSRRSLETSLRELRTDRIDLFLLHEATLADVRTPGLMEFLQDARREGKIRAFGLGTSLPNALAVIAEAPESARVVQIANGFGHFDLERLPVDLARVTLTHGALKILPTLEAALDRGVLGVDWQRFGSPRGTALAGWLLGMARHDDPAGVTLFSSTRPERIRQNVAHALKHEGRTADEWSAFRQTVERTLAALREDVR